jgi:hypothetical protein
MAFICRAVMGSDTNLSCLVIVWRLPYIILYSSVHIGSDAVDFFNGGTDYRSYRPLYKTHCGVGFSSERTDSFSLGARQTFAGINEPTSRLQAPL